MNSGMTTNTINKEEESLDSLITRMREEASALTMDQLKHRIKALEAETSSWKGEVNRFRKEMRNFEFRIKDSKDKLKLNTQLPHLISTVAEIFDLEDSDEEGDSGSGVKKSKNPGQQSKGAIVKTSTRQTIFLPVIGLIEAKELRPLELVGVNKDTYLIFEKLPPEYDSRVKVMELEEKPKEELSDIGGLEKQILELDEAIVLPIEHKHLFDAIGIKPPKGVLMYGPPGTGKTMMARACAARTNATFMKLAGSQLVQMFIGDGAKMVRDAFALAKEKAPTVIFIDEIDAIGVKRSDSEAGGGREVQRTMLELLNQLDGFTANDQVKVIAATNRPDVLDPALMRSGRLDRKIEFPMPNEESRGKIIEIHSRKMNYDPKMVNFKELSRSTEDFNGAMLKAVAVEAGMQALRRSGVEVTHEDFVEGINSVKSKKKAKLYYYS
jgi:26S proteasome regulatory subunit T5